MHKLALILMILLLVIPSSLIANEVALPSDTEVKVALQSILVAAAATVAAQNLTPPLEFTEAQFIGDGSLSFFALSLQDADVGLLRKIVLESPAPPPRQMGFLEALLTAMVSVLPDYYKMVEFLKPQALLEQEVILTGTMEAIRLATPYPFRYEGGGTMAVAGSRISTPFTLEFTFVVPLEGPAGSAIIPIRLLANGADYLAVAKSLFKAPRGVDIEAQLQLIL